MIEIIPGGSVLIAALDSPVLPAWDPSTRLAGPQRLLHPSPSQCPSIFFSPCISFLK